MPQGRLPAAPYRRVARKMAVIFEVAAHDRPVALDRPASLRISVGARPVPHSPFLENSRITGPLVQERITERYRPVTALRGLSVVERAYSTAIQEA